MKYVRPYGSSVVKEVNTKRILLPNKEVLKSKDATFEAPKCLNYWEDNPKLFIAQYISIIDKIFNKPHEKLRDEISKACLKNRQNLGRLIWEYLQEKYNISDALKPLWDSKVEARQKKYPQKIEGPWCRKFTNTSQQNEGNYRLTQTPSKIDAHIFESAQRLHSKTPEKGLGLIPRQALAIKSNILKEKSSSSKDYKKEDFLIYENVIKDIYEEIQERLEKEEKIELLRKNLKNSKTKNKEKDSLRTQITALESKILASEKPYIIAMRHLKTFLKSELYPDFADYKKEIDADNIEGKEPSDKFKFYMDVCALYKKLLKNPKTKGKNRRDKITRNLPKNYTQLFDLLKHQNNNKDINHLIRFGKIIHYTASQKANADIQPNQDHTAFIIEYFPDETEIQKSSFWGSDGQILIKQNEAFVRVFRTTIAFAARTFEDWVDPDNDIQGKDGHDKDILMQRAEAAEKLKEADFDHKIKLLFRSDLQLKNFDEKKELIKAVGDHLYNLRNASFHFKGLLTFIEELRKSKSFTNSGKPRDPKPLAEKKYQQAYTVMQTLYVEDCKQRNIFIKNAMESAGFHYFFKDTTIRKFYSLLQQSKPSTLPLPNLKHVLERVQDAWKKKDFKLSLPAYPTSDEWEEKQAGQVGNWKVAQNIFLKMLYDKPFKNWLETNSAKENIYPFIEEAIKRATQEARTLNGKDLEEKTKLLITARAEALEISGQDIRENKTYLEEFLYSLAGKTASEMRVQKGYESDPEQAKKQAAFIENLKKDVIAQAFETYLKDTLGENEFENLVKPERSTTEKTGNISRRFPTLGGEVNEERETENWESSFYFFLHLVPIQILNELYHQLLKYSLVTQKNDRKEAEEERKLLEKLLSLFTLYHDMSSGQFENLCKDKAALKSLKLKEYFEPPALFEEVFKLNEQKTETPHVMKGLREFLRFGKNHILHPILEKHKISQSQFNVLEKCNPKEEPNIATHQKRLKALHEEWVKKKSKFAKHDEYKKALKAIEDYRHLNAHLTLQNHVRLFTLSMRIIGRLLDYSGLWERNLYFIFLALLHKQEVKIKDLEKLEGLTEKTSEKDGKLFVFKGKIKNGEIVAALSILEQHKIPLISMLKDYMGIPQETDLGESDLVTIRNKLAHFAMLQEKSSKFSLTTEINKTRKLMAHDRKLKNAVTKSIIELMDREGLKLKWKMTNNKGEHTLKSAEIVAKEIFHLGTSKKKKEAEKIVEKFVGKEYVAMVHDIF